MTIVFVSAVAPYQPASRRRFASEIVTTNRARADLLVEHRPFDLDVVRVRREAVRAAAQAPRNPRCERRMGRPVGVDVVEVEVDDVARDRRADRDGDERAEQEARRADRAADGPDPRPEVGRRPAAQPMELGGEHRARPRPEVVGPVDEGRRAGLDDRLALEDQREDLDMMAEPLELEDLVEDERLRGLRKSRHQVGQAERPVRTDGSRRGRGGGAHPAASGRPGLPASSA